MNRYIPEIYTYLTFFNQFVAASHRILQYQQFTPLWKINKYWKKLRIVCQNMFITGNELQQGLGLAVLLRFCYESIFITLDSDTYSNSEFCLKFFFCMEHQSVPFSKVSSAICDDVECSIYRLQLHYSQIFFFAFLKVNVCTSKFKYLSIFYLLKWYL